MGRFSGALDPERYEMLTDAIDRRTASLASGSEEAVEKNANLAVAALIDLVTSDGSGARPLPSVTVIVDAETLARGPHPATVAETAAGHALSPESIARLCCDATLRRVVFDSDGVPIDVGRRHRTATEAQWAALKAVYSSCGWGGCAAPIGWCQAHHIREWEHGGPTDLDNLVPLCSRHHHLVHEGRWRLRLLGDRALELRRPDGTLQATVPRPMRC